MEEKDKKPIAGKKKQIILIVVAICAVIAVAVLVFAQRPAENTQPSAEPTETAASETSEPAETEETEQTVETTVPEVTASATEETEPPLEEQYTGYELETPIGKLCYPEEWTDKILVETETVEDTYSAVFFSKLESENVVIFTLYVGENGQGYQMGSMDGQAVWIDVPGIEPGEAWSEADAEQVANMQSRVNDILDQIYKQEGFEKSEPEI